MALLVGLAAVSGIELPWTVVASIAAGGLMLASVGLALVEPIVARLSGAGLRLRATAAAR